MMILALIGSYRKRGNTARMVRMIEQQLVVMAAGAGQSLTVEVIFLGDQDIRPCLGCRTCFNRGEKKCPLKDDLLSIKQKMQAADAVIVASPVYVNDVSGTVKIWMDRLAHVCHRPAFAGKSAYLLATVGSGPANHALRTMDMALRQWGFYIVGQTSFKTGALLAQPALEDRYRNKSVKIAEKIYTAVAEQRFLKPSFLSLMTFKIQQRYWQRNRDDSLDYAYWQSQGWTDSGRSYYSGHQANFLKVVLARLSGSLLAWFVT